MRKIVTITIDLEDNDEESYNWLVDTIALEQVVEESLTEGATVHSISVTVNDDQVDK